MALKTIQEKNKMKQKPQDITKHYTSEAMAKDLIALLDFDYNTSVLDACSGKNKVWYNNLNVKEKYECEIEDGSNFYDWNKKVDWIIGNPPYHESWQITLHALNIANYGIAWLLNNQVLNSHNTPARIEKMQQHGFYLQRMHVVADKRWFGRYYFVIYEKKPSSILTYKRLSY